MMHHMGPFTYVPECILISTFTFLVPFLDSKKAILMLYQVIEVVLEPFDLNTLNTIFDIVLNKHVVNIGKPDRKGSNEVFWR